MPRILVADDNTNIQKMVALAFQESGIDVISVGNGEAAVRRMPDLNPDLILADIFMPVRNGYEVCEWVKKDTKFSQTPVILLVGAFDPLDEKEARRVGADGILKKPFIPPDPLIAMVTLVLERNPKIAAELARAKEKKQEKEIAPEPLPASEMAEIPARAASKPLPEFPDPTPEEESLIYAFGTGRRVLDGEGSSPDEPPAPKAEDEPETENENEFDSASTTSDWRRSAMQFEVPEEAAMQPAIPSEEYLEATFPSEHAAPEQVTHASAEQPEPAAQDSSLGEFPAPWPVASAASEEPPSAPGPRPASHDEPELHGAPAMEEATPEPSFASQATHWMDMMASAPGRPAGDWFSSVSSVAPASELAQVSQQAVQPLSSGEIDAEPETPAAAERSEPAATFGREESFFADEPEPGAGSSIPQDRLAEAIPAETGEERSAYPVSASQDRDREIVPEPSGETGGFFKDENLVEPPAVRVVPEPLLADEDAQSGPSAYNSHSEAVASAHSFTDSPGERALRDTHAEEFQAESESFTEKSNERFPTIPPPNREALADIPFLNPPRHLGEDASALNDIEPDAVGSAAVDTIVEKILAKIEPQLRDLLSQGVKPLVENLLHGELEKHRK